MSLNPERLLTRLDSLGTTTTQLARYVIAFSGGLDSTVLLHALAITRREHGKRLLAVHVDHGLHADSADWAGHCLGLLSDSASIAKL